MTRIVTTTYRYKPPPKRKGRKLAVITGPAVVTSPTSRSIRQVAHRKHPTPPPANDDTPRRSAIVIVHTRKKVQRQREQQQIARIVTFVPKRQRDAWTRYLRLTGLTDPDAPPPP